jgi:hypothetical protein
MYHGLRMSKGIVPARWLAAACCVSCVPHSRWLCIRVLAGWLDCTYQLGAGSMQQEKRSRIEQVGAAAGRQVAVDCEGCAVQRCCRWRARAGPLGASSWASRIAWCRFHEARRVCALGQAGLAPGDACTEGDWRGKFQVPRWSAARQQRLPSLAPAQSLGSGGSGGGG